jgi:hypothetical protein
MSALSPFILQSQTLSWGAVNGANGQQQKLECFLSSGLYRHIIFDTTGGAMLIKETRKAAQDWCDAWNRRDLDAIMDHYSDDVEFSSPTIIKRWGIADGWLRGKAKVRENFAIGVKAPNLRFELVDVLLGVNSMCVVYRRESGALVTDLVELDDNGKGRRVTACYGSPPTK